MSSLLLAAAAASLPSFQGPGEPSAFGCCPEALASSTRTRNCQAAVAAERARAEQPAARARVQIKMVTHANTAAAAAAACKPKPAHHNLPIDEDDHGGLLVGTSVPIPPSTGGYASSVDRVALLGRS